MSHRGQDPKREASSRARTKLDTMNCGPALRRPHGASGPTQFVVRPSGGNRIQCPFWWL